MNVLLLETMYITQNGQDFVVGQKTNGVVRKNVVYFYDTTRTVAVGFSTSYCKENRQLFLVNRSMTDRDASIKHITEIIDTMPIDGLAGNEIIRILSEKIKSL